MQKGKGSVPEKSEQKGKQLKDADILALQKVLSLLCPS